GDHDLAPGNRRVSHRVERVDHKIQQDLLKLNRITFDRAQACIERGFHLARTQQRIGRHHAHCVHHHLVEIYRATRHLSFLYHPTNAAHNIARTPTIRDDVAEQLAHFAQVNVPLIDKALSSCGVTENSSQRLI